LKALWEQVLGVSPELGRWLDGRRTELGAGRLPRSAWAIVAGSVVRASTARGRTVLVLVPAPERFCDELRMWLGGKTPAHVFAEVGVSFLDRPPAFDEAVHKRLDALAALADPAGPPCVVVSSRRACTRATISRADLVRGTVTLVAGRGLDPVGVASKLVELGYSREPLVEEPGQFSVRGGILDVFPAAADAPVRAEWSGEVIETLRVFDPSNQRSVMAIPVASIRPGRELLLGPDRGAAAAARLRSSVDLEALRSDVRADWEEELERLASGAAFPGVE